MSANFDIYCKGFHPLRVAVCLYGKTLTFQYKGSCETATEIQKYMHLIEDWCERSWVKLSVHKSKLIKFTYKRNVTKSSTAASMLIWLCHMGFCSSITNKNDTNCTKQNPENYCNRTVV